MKKHRTLLPAILFVLFFTAVCISALLAVDYAMGYTNAAKELYGPSNPSLSSLQYYRLCYILVENQNLLLFPQNVEGPEIIFPIEPGESADSVLQRMESVGLVPDRDILRSYLIYTGYDTQLQAGEFLLSPMMTPVEIVEAVLDTNPQLISFNILPGWRLEEIAASLPTSGLNITAEEFLQAADSRTAPLSLIDNLPHDATLEGFLLPDEYKIRRTLNAEQLILSFLENFEAQVTLELQKAFEQQGLTLYQAVTLASIVEREAVAAEEQPIIASVFYNRLAASMLLETDPTVQYALGYNTVQNTWWTNPLTFQDLDFDSPFNTYLYPGLPPGPIANPSLSALQATAYPAQTTYYFFRAACDGSGRHNFAQTFEEHQNNACP